MENKNINDLEKEEIIKINKLIDEASKCVFSKESNLSKAKELLLEFFDKTKDLYQNNEEEYYSFSNLLEFILYTSKYKSDKKIVWVSIEYSRAYNLYAYICNEEKNYELAISMIDKAIKYNPLDVNGYFEKAETYKLQKKWEEMKDVSLEALENIFDAISLARLYRNLGHYYIEKNRLDVAFTLYSYSTIFDKNEMAYHEMKYIKHLLKKENYSVSKEEVKNILQNINLTLGINPENFKILLGIFNNEELCKEREYIRDSVEFRLFALTGDKMFAPFFEEIDNTIGFSILIPKRWKKMKKEILEEKIKNKEIDHRTIFIFLPEEGYISQVVYENKCVKEDFLKTYKLNIENMKKSGHEILFENVLSIGGREIRSAFVDIVEGDKTIRFLHDFLIIKDYFIDFSIMVDSKIDFNDMEKVVNDPKVLQILSILNSIKELENK